MNITYRNELELLYGQNSEVEINEVRYITNTKEYLIDCTLKVSDINLFMESQTDGLKFLFEESWKYTGVNNPKIRLVTKFDVIS